MSIPSVCTDKSSSPRLGAEIEESLNRESVEEFAERLGDPDFDGGDRVRLATVIRSLRQDQRISICRLMDRLNLSGMDDLHQAMSLRAIAALSLNEREVLVDGVRAHEERLKSEDKVLLLECLGALDLLGIDPHKKVKLTLDTLPLLSPQMSLEERGLILKSLKERSERARGGLVECVNKIALPSYTASNLVQLLETAANLHPEIREGVIDAALPFFHSETNCQERVEMLQALASLKSQDREQVASSAKRLQFLKTDRFDPMSMIHLLSSPAVKRLPVDGREKLLKSTHFIFSREMNEADRSLVLSSLLKIDRRELDHVVQYVVRSMHLVRDSSLAQLIETIRAIPKEDRQDVIHRADPFLPP